jgi:hypothetical protein
MLNQSFLKSFHLSHPDKIELKKISSPSENKNYVTAQQFARKDIGMSGALACFLLGLENRP